MTYGYKKQLDTSFENAVEVTKTALADEGFGVLSEIDVAATLKKKLDIDYGKYVILGACHPESAHRALEAEKDIGILLPCNVIVYEDSGAVFVSAMLPTVAMGIIKNETIDEIAEEIEERLKRVVDEVETM